MTKKTVAGSVDSVMAQGDEPLSNRSSNAYFGDILERRFPPVPGISHDQGHTIGRVGPDDRRYGRQPHRADDESTAGRRDGMRFLVQAGHRRYFPGYKLAGKPAWIFPP